ncbi:hypothetical protein ACFWBC_02580 [Streptomyces sp. NPDC059985]|uniref:hypothetical protein n=1 Tax=Streptomyces sp. NPDC059985 TaxID=3347025 RepID=UPI0036CF3351
MSTHDVAAPVGTGHAGPDPEGDGHGHRRGVRLGLADGPDGTLYVAEERGRVSRWKVRHAT